MTSCCSFFSCFSYWDWFFSSLACSFWAVCSRCNSLFMAWSFFSYSHFTFFAFSSEYDSTEPGCKGVKCRVLVRHGFALPRLGTSTQFPGHANARAPLSWRFGLIGFIIYSSHSAIAKLFDGRASNTDGDATEDPPKFWSTWSLSSCVSRILCCSIISFSSYCFFSVCSRFWLFSSSSISFCLIAISHVIFAKSAW